MIYDISISDSLLKRYYNLPCQTTSILRPRSLDRLNEDLDCALLALDTVPWVVDDTMAGREIPQAGRLAGKIMDKWPNYSWRMLEVYSL